MQAAEREEARAVAEREEVKEEVASVEGVTALVGMGLEVWVVETVAVTGVAAKGVVAREEERAGEEREEGAGGAWGVTRVCRSEPPVAGLVPGTAAAASAEAAAAATAAARVVGELVGASAEASAAAGSSARERARLP